MSRVLMLSRHKGQLDRRIIAEINTLIASGRHVTLVSIPTVIPPHCFDGPVRLIMQPVDQAASHITARLKHLVHRLPSRLENLMKTAWHCLHLSSLSDYFLEVTPRETFDVIHCHDLDTLPAGVALRNSIAPSAKLIYDAHEFFPFQYPIGAKRQRDWSRMEDSYIRETSLVLTVNETIAGELTRLYGIAKPEVIYNSYGTQSSSTQLTEQTFLEHFEAQAGGFRVIYQGAFIREKNLENLLKAFRGLTASTQLFLLGTGPAEMQLKTLRKKCGLSHVFFGPWVPQEDLLHYLAHAHLGIIPYTGSTILNNLYCTPNKLFEFIEAEIPICASDLPELRRIVAGNGIGDVYPMENAEAIACAIETCRARALRGDFAASARRATRKMFAWEKQGTKLVALYEKLGV